MRTDLRGAVAVVTGGAGDIGAAIGGRLAAAGAAVHLWDVVGVDQGEAVAEQVGCAYHRVDVRDQNAVNEATNGLSRLDIAVGCAGIVRSSPFLDIRLAEWRDQLDVNLTGCFMLGQAASRRMVGDKTAGRIVFVGSWVGDVPWPEIAAYSASKAAVQMLARTMARELAVQQVRVNVVAPGIVDAGLARHQLATEPQYAARVAKAIPLGALQTVESVADAVYFVCSPAGSYMTGATLLVDGGCSIQTSSD